MSSRFSWATFLLLSSLGAAPGCHLLEHHQDSTPEFREHGVHLNDGDEVSSPKREKPTDKLLSPLTDERSHSIEARLGY